MEISQVYQRVFSTLGEVSMSSMIRVASEIMEMPVVVTDAAFIVLEKYPLVAVADEQWDANAVNHQINAKYINIFQRDDHWSAYRDAQQTVYLDWGYFEKSPRYSTPCTVRGKTVGYIAALATGIEPQPWHIEALDIIAQAFALIVEAESNQRYRGEEVSEALFQALLRDELKTREDFEHMRQVAQSSLIPDFILMVLKMRRPSDGAFMIYLGKEFESLFGNTPCVLQNESLYIMPSGITSDYLQTKEFGEVLRYLSENEAQCGMSRVFSDPYPLSDYRWQAEMALAVGRQVAPAHTVFRYDDFVMDIAVSVLHEKVSAANFVHPALVLLDAYDKEHATQYFKTLEVYMLNALDIAETIMRLNIHRNTLSYRLGKIKEIGNIDSFGGNEGLHLYLSFCYLHIGAKKSAGQSSLTP